MSSTNYIYQTIIKVLTLDNTQILDHVEMKAN